MYDLIVIGFPDAKTAEAARDELFALPSEEIFRVSDVVVATRDEKGAIKLIHLVHPSALNLGTGLTSGLLIGLIFLHPIFGILVGAAAGAVGEGLSECGVDEGFIKQIDDLLRSGRAALLLRRDISTEHVVSDQIVARLASLGGRVLKTNLNASLENRLQQAFEEARRCAHREAASSANSAPAG